MESRDNEPQGCWHPQKLSSANNFLVNQWWASLPGVRQPPPPPPLLLRTRKWDGLHYVYCCSSWWAPILGTWLVMRAQLNIVIFHVLAEQEVRLWWRNNISTALRWPLPSDPYNKYTRSHCSLRPFKVKKGDLPQCSNKTKQQTCFTQVCTGFTNLKTQRTGIHWFDSLFLFRDVKISSMIKPNCTAFSKRQHLF